MCLNNIELENCKIVKTVRAMNYHIYEEPFWMLAQKF